MCFFLCFYIKYKYLFTLKRISLKIMIIINKYIFRIKMDKNYFEIN